MPTQDGEKPGNTGESDVLPKQEIFKCLCLKIRNSCIEKKHLDFRTTKRGWFPTSRFFSIQKKRKICVILFWQLSGKGTKQTMSLDETQNVVFWETNQNMGFDTTSLVFMDSVDT